MQALRMDKTDSGISVDEAFNIDFLGALNLLAPILCHTKSWNIDRFGVDFIKTLFASGDDVIIRVSLYNCDQPRRSIR